MSDPDAGSDADTGHGSDSGSGSVSDSGPAPGATPSPDGGADESTPAASVADRIDVDDAVIGVQQTLDPRIRYRWIAGSAVGAAVLGAGVGIGVFVLAGSASGGNAELAGRIGGAVFALSLVVGVVRAVLLYRSWEYVVRGDSLFLSRGVLTRVRTVAPYVRVQHIDTQRGPVERLLGLSTLVVYTAGSRGADVTIPGLAPDRAADLQDRLKRLAIGSEEEDAV